MSLVNLSLQSFFNTDTHGEDRFVRCAQFISRRLKKAQDALVEIDFYFEASEAGSLSDRFAEFAEDDGSPEDFATLWNDLEDWSGATVHYNNRDKTLYNIPHLPDRFAC